MIDVGSVVHFHSTVAGKAKYHFCFSYVVENGLNGLMFLNSQGGFEDEFECDCTKIPELPVSRTGKTFFSCPTVMRKTQPQLDSLNAKVIAKISPDLAAEFLKFAYTIKSMTNGDKSRLISTLKNLSNS